MPRKTTPHLIDALDQYLTVRASHCPPNTVTNDRPVLRRFVHGVGNPQSHLLEASDVQAWFANEAGRQQATSYNKCRSRVAGFTEFLARRRWLEVDVLSNVRPRRVV